MKRLISEIMMRRQMSLQATAEAMPSSMLLQQRLRANPIWQCLRYQRNLLNKSRERRTLRKLRCTIGPKLTRGILTKSTRY
jgi:hypothetical protein